MYSLQWRTKYEYVGRYEELALGTARVWSGVVICQTAVRAAIIQGVR